MTAEVEKDVFAEAKQLAFDKGLFIVIRPDCVLLYRKGSVHSPANHLVARRRKLEHIFQVIKRY